ncbi:MAG: hypothetical protein K2N48_11370 [Muribaculaceae bacterium]|nr:hypothetical protein [Muribaculaceae bacterium]
MSYYCIEKEGQSNLRGGFKTNPRNPNTSNSAMTPCVEFASQAVCNLFNENLLIGLERIYAKYKNTSPIIGQRVYWITTSSRTHLKTFVGQDVICKDIAPYKLNYTFLNEVDRDTAMQEMQEYMNSLYATFKKIDY